MAAKKKAAKAGAAAIALKRSPYVQRLAEDEELRQNLWQAYESARGAVGRLQNGKSHGRPDLRRQAAAQGHQDRGGVVPRRVGGAARGAQASKKSGGGFGKLLLLPIVGGAVALAVSEGLRKKVLDTLFGAEEEFEYTSNTSPPAGSSASTSETAGSTT